MRLFLVIILVLALWAFPVWAQDVQEEDISGATSSLQSVLSTLKDSVDKLSLDNEQLAARDKYAQAKILQLRMELGKLQAEGNDLNKSVSSLQVQNPRRSQQISRLQEENSNLDNYIQNAQNSLDVNQKSLDAGYSQDQQLLLQLRSTAGVAPALPVPSVESPAALRRQKEKLALMKMIYDSKERQEALHASILELQKNMPVLPAAGALAHQQFLKEQIKDLQDQMAVYPSEGLSGVSGNTAQWEDAQLRQLELELRSLERNYAQLKDLTDKMNKKAQSIKASVGDQVEGEKLQNSIEDLEHQGEGLRADLDDLRTQMVDLDKRKSRLEEMIKQLP